MKKSFALLVGVLSLCVLAQAQDEGTIIKKERIDKNMGFFIGGGPSLTLGKNIGDYSTGFNFELGFVKRLNRVLSIGPSVSYISFKYDPDVTDVNGGAYIGEGDPNDWETEYFQYYDDQTLEDYGLDDYEYTFGYLLTLQGGDISLVSVGLNLKLNFIPVRDDSKISVYGFVKPFISMASRKEVSGEDERYVYEFYEEDGDLWYEEDEWFADGYEGEWGAEDFDALKATSNITGGIFLGPGIEFMPAKTVSVFVQATFGYTFPVDFVSTKAYKPTLNDYLDEEFPMVKKGFPSLNLQAGLTFNF